MKHSFWFLCALILSTSGCAVPGILDRTMPADVMDDVHVFTRNDGRVSNPIDRALATCHEQTEASETLCVTEALSRSTLGLHALVSLIPGCRLGSICFYDHTTRRRLGLIPSYATLVVKHWRVSFDLRRAVTEVVQVPIKVTDRDVFVVPPKADKPRVLSGALTNQP